MQEKENIVNKVCKDLNLNQKELAELIGVTTNTISGWKNGVRKIPKWGFRVLELVKLEREHHQLINTITKYKL